MIYPRRCRGHGHREQRSILPLLICQTAHLLCSTLAGPDTPALTCQPELVSYSVLLVWLCWVTVVVDVYVGVREYSFPSVDAALCWDLIGRHCVHGNALEVILGDGQHAVAGPFMMHLKG